MHSARLGRCTHEGDRRGRVALSEAPAAKLRLERCAAQAESLVFLSHAVLRSSIATGRKRLGEFEMVLVMEDGRQDFTHERAHRTTQKSSQ